MVEKTAVLDDGRNQIQCHAKTEHETDSGKTGSEYAQQIQDEKSTIIDSIYQQSLYQKVVKSSNSTEGAVQQIVEQENNVEWGLNQHNHEHQLIIFNVHDSLQEELPQRDGCQPQETEDGGEN